MRLAWNEPKRRSNLQKHHWDFVDAVQLFQHPYVRRIDSRKDYQETHAGAPTVLFTKESVSVYTRSGIR